MKTYRHIIRTAAIIGAMAMWSCSESPSSDGDTGSAEETDRDTGTETEHGTGTSGDGDVDGDGDGDTDTDVGDTETDSAEGTEFDTDSELDSDSTPTDGYHCVRDAELLEERWDCNRDDQCPCGTHCEEGRCDYECTQDDDCDGWCDFFGRCRAADDEASTPSISGETEGRLKLSTSFLTIFDASETRNIRVAASGADLKDVRVAAGEGLLVQCDDAFVRECRIPAVSAGGESVVVSVTPDGEAPDRKNWTVRFYAENEIKLAGQY